MIPHRIGNDDTLALRNGIQPAVTLESARVAASTMKSNDRWLLRPSILAKK